MKKLLSLLLVIALTFPFVPTIVEAAETKPINLSKQNLTIYVGAKTKIQNTGTAKNIKWSSSKPNVVSVSQKGVLTAKTPGKATIVAKSGNKKSKCTVIVKKNLNALQLRRKLNKKVETAKNLTIKYYVKSIKPKYFCEEKAVNIKEQIAYQDISHFDGPKMYVSGTKVFWFDSNSKKWFFCYRLTSYVNVKIEDILEPIDFNDTCKLLKNRTFNNKKCAVLQTHSSITGRTYLYYFDLSNYELLGRTSGSGNQKNIDIYDFKTKLKIPNNIIKQATYKEM